MLMLLSMPSSATSCPNDPEAASRAATLRSGIQGEPDTAHERLLEALALKIEELCEVRDQRNVEMAEHAKTRTQRDVLNGENVELRKSRLQLEQELTPLRIEVVQLDDALTRQKRLTKVWTVSALIAGVIIGAAAGGYVGVQAAK